MVAGYVYGALQSNIYKTEIILREVPSYSALDGITEKIIMDAIHDFRGQKTIIMTAYRLKTVQKCDTIFMIDQGKVTAQGTFEELLKTNEHFKKMASHA